MNYVPYTTQAVIGYDNVFARGTISASGYTTSGPPENAVDGLTFDFWETEGDTSGDRLNVDLAAPESVDYLAIAAHTLGSSGATITVRKSLDGVTYSNAAGPFTPTEDKPYLWRFPTTNAFAYWQVRIDGGDSVRLGVVNLGRILVLPEGIYVGHKPATLNKKPELLNNKSDRGQLLGRSVLRTTASVSIKQDLVEPDWVREVWKPFAAYAENNPFFFAWRYDTYPDEVMFGWTEEGAEAEHASTRYMRVSLDMVGQA
jgi:hypothetical protein